MWTTYLRLLCNQGSNPRLQPVHQPLCHCISLVAARKIAYPLLCCIVSTSCICVNVTRHAHVLWDRENSSCWNCIGSWCSLGTWFVNQTPDAAGHLLLLLWWCDLLITYSRWTMTSSPYGSPGSSQHSSSLSCLKLGEMLDWLIYWAWQFCRMFSIQVFLGLPLWRVPCVWPCRSSFGSLSNSRNCTIW